MKLLILSEEVWNDKRYPNNVMTNWFEGFEGQLANLYLASGMPDNPCCSEYFQITDRMALGNLMGQKGGGRWFASKESKAFRAENRLSSILLPLKHSRIKKEIKLVFGDGLRLLRDAVWLKTKWEGSLLTDFLEDFKLKFLIEFPIEVSN